MDYAIFKQVESEQPHTIHTFRQSETNHRALTCAKRQLIKMYSYALGLSWMINVKFTGKHEFEYDNLLQSGKPQHIRMYIGQFNNQK